jgi:hypothetical protein
MLTQWARVAHLSNAPPYSPASDQEIQPKECCCRCTESDNNYTFRVERIQRQIDEPICAHGEQSQGANQVDRSAHAASPVNASVDQERLCPLRTLVGAMVRYESRLGSRKFTQNLRRGIAFSPTRCNRRVPIAAKSQFNNLSWVGETSGAS